MFRHPLGLEWGTVGGEEGWLDPRVKDVKKLLPKNMGAKEERKIWKQLSQQQAKERHSKRWFVGDNTVKGTKPDLTPVKNVGGKKGMRSLLQKRTKDLAWEKGWSQLNPNQIAELGGKGDRVTNKVAQQLMKADELAVQKALGQPLSPEIQQLNKTVTQRDTFNKALSRTEELRNFRKGGNNQTLNGSEVATINKELIAPPTAPKLTPEPLKLTKREQFALGQARGSIAQNKARLKQMRIENQLPSAKTEQIASKVTNNPSLFPTDKTNSIVSPELKSKLLDNKKLNENLQKAFKPQSKDFLKKAGGDLAKAFVPDPLTLAIRAGIAIGEGIFNPTGGDKLEPVRNQRGRALSQNEDDLMDPFKWLA